MQPKSVVFSLLAALCAGALYFAFQDASGPEAPVAPLSGEEALQGEPVAMTGSNGFTSADSVRRTELDPSSVPTNGFEASTQSTRLVRGRVVDKNGAPVEGAEVRHLAERPDGRRHGLLE